MFIFIQELQQDVGSLLLFRQAVLAALPHLQQQQQAMRPVQQQQQQQQQSWARRKHVQGNSRSLEDDSTTATTTTTGNHQVADSGFSTEASNNSNTSPRSSRFDAAPMGLLQGLDHLPPPPPPPPVEKELVQHLERVQQRLARLRKDEDRLLTLLNPMRPRLASNPSASVVAAAAEEDELMRLLDQIQIQSSALKLATASSSTINVNVEQQQDKKKQEVTDVCPPASPPPPPVRGNASPTASPLPPTTGASAAATKSSGPGSGKTTLTREQVSAVLRLTNPVQLQRHLLRALLDNQVTIRAIASFFFSFTFLQRELTRLAPLKDRRWFTDRYIHLLMFNFRDSKKRRRRTGQILQPVTHDGVPVVESLYNRWRPLETRTTIFVSRLIGLFLFYTFFFYLLQGLVIASTLEPCDSLTHTQLRERKRSLKMSGM